MMLLNDIKLHHHLIVENRKLKTQMTFPEICVAYSGPNCVSNWANHVENESVRTELTQMPPSVQNRLASHNNTTQWLMVWCLQTCTQIKKLSFRCVRLNSEIQFRNFPFQLSQLGPRQSWDHCPLHRSVVRSSSAFRSSNSWSWDGGRVEAFSFFSFCCRCHSVPITSNR